MKLVRKRIAVDSGGRTRKIIVVVGTGTAQPLQTLFAKKHFSMYQRKIVASETRRVCYMPQSCWQQYNILIVALSN